MRKEVIILPFPEFLLGLNFVHFAQQASKISGIKRAWCCHFHYRCNSYKKSLIFIDLVRNIMLTVYKIADESSLHCKVGIGVTNFLFNSCWRTPSSLCLLYKIILCDFRTFSSTTSVNFKNNSLITLWWF